MRQWRVGTISMGLTLIILGIILFSTKIIGFDLTSIMMSWWPLILVVLGIEILVYLFKSKETTPLLKYDFLSIIFVGIIGMVGISFMIIQTIGLADYAQAYISSEYRTYDLPQLNYDLDKSVKRIVVETGNHPLTVEGINSQEIAMFGTYGVFAHKTEELVKNSDDYVSVNKKDDTVYISMKNVPIKYNRHQQFPAVSATLLVPQNIKLEVNSNYNDLTIKPRKLLSNWNIDRAANIDVQLNAESDILLIADTIREISTENDGWEIITESNSSSGNSARVDKATVDQANNYEVASANKIRTAMYHTGQGTNELNITDVDSLSLTMLK